jgi:TrmH family RNA methyltransferase
LLAARQPVALVFGRERSGLTNAELDRCHYLVNIPANPTYASLNMASAVQIICYELQLAGQQMQPATAEDSEQALATAEELEGMYQHLERTLIAIGYLDPANPRLLMRRIRRLFARAQPDKAEVNIVRGILKCMERRRRED